MWGSIAGDMIGAPYEGWPGGPVAPGLWGGRSRFTDDTVLTLAVADALLEGRSFGDSLVRWYRRHPGRGYGGWFAAWAQAGGGDPYGSFGNGGAMRVAPAAWAAETVTEAVALARESAAATHDHPDGLAGAEAVALAIFLAREGAVADEIVARVTRHTGYDLDVPVESLSERYALDARASESVPAALCCFLGAESVESAIRRAVSVGGDADTIACMAGAVAEAYHGGLPEAMLRQVRERLAPDLLDVADRFSVRYGVPVVRK